MGGGGWPKDIHNTFFGNVVRGKSALFRLVVRNGFAHFVRKVFARRKLLPGKFWVFVPLASMHYHLEDLFSVSVLKDKQVNLGRTFQLSNFGHDLLNPLDVIFCVDKNLY